MKALRLILDIIVGIIGGLLGGCVLALMFVGNALIVLTGDFFSYCKERSALRGRKTNSDPDR